MSLQEYVDTCSSMREIFYYLFDASEWIHFSDNQDNYPQVQTYKKGVFEKPKKCFVVFVEDDGLLEYSKKVAGKNFILTRPKPALSYFIKMMDLFDVEGILVNNFYFIEKAEFKKAREVYIYDYYQVAVGSLDEIEDEEMRDFQYMRAFFMLPEVYILRLKGHDGSVLAMKNKLPDGERGNDTAFVFDTYETAQEYIARNKMNGLDIDISSFSTDLFISEEFNEKLQYIMVNGNHRVSFEEFKELEQMFLIVE